MLDASIGEYEDAALSVRAPTTGPLEAALDPVSAAVLRDGLSVLRVETTRVAGRTIADPLPPLAEVATVESGEVARLVLRVHVPDGTAPGVYSGLLQLTLGGSPLRSVPVTLRVWDVRQPALDDPGGFRTLFLVNPQTYEHAVTKRTGVSPNTHGAAIIGRLYALLSQYRISPGSWGYGTPFPGGRVATHALDTMSEAAQAVFRNETVGFIFQSFNLIPVLSAMENVLLPGSLGTKLPVAGRGPRNFVTGKGRPRCLLPSDRESPLGRPDAASCHCPSSHQLSGPDFGGRTYGQFGSCHRGDSARNLGGRGS